MHKPAESGVRISEQNRMKDLELLPSEVLDAYLEVAKYHHKLLARLAQR